MSLVSRTLLAGMLCLAAPWAGAAADEADDINPVFASLPQMGGTALEGARGLGAEDIVQQVEFAPSVTDSTIQSGGVNSIADGAFSNSEVFAAVVQNTGNFVSVQNLLAVNVTISD